MATIGRVLLIPKGDYNASATYNSLDWVRYNGCAWVCKVNGTVGVVPTETAPEWQVLAKDGNVSGSIAWIDITGKPFNGVGNGLNVDGSNNIELDINMLTGSNISYDNSDSGLSANDIQSAIDELAGSSTDVSWNQIQGATGSTKIAEIEIDGTTQEVYAPTGGGGGMLPYLYIDSEAGATVTVNQPDGTTITPTAAGSGHWECELTGGYGTYVIHSVLSGQGDATLSLAVDTVKEYHVTDTHYDYTINVTAPSGSSVRITGGGETYTGTGTGSSQAFAVHTPSTTYTVAVTMDGNTKSETITSAATSGQSGSVTIAFGTINLTYANDFRGKTITCTKNGVTVTKTAPSSGNTMTFRVPTTGTWTISGTVSGQTYSVEAVVTSLSTAVSVNLQTIPDGKTVTPTDNIQKWLNCAGIYNKTSYTTISDVLGDATTLLALMSDNNAVDYLVRSTTWATDICARSTAMTDIGANNYAADTLLADADWCEAIINSTYIDSVLNVKVPTMTSNTTPSGVASASGSFDTNYSAWKAFDNNTSTSWQSNTVNVPHWIGYEFSSNIIIKAFKYFRAESDTYTYTMNLQAYDENTNNWIDLTQQKSYKTSSITEAVVNNTAYKKYRFYITNTDHYGQSKKIASAKELQFYGREDV